MACSDDDDEGEGTPDALRCPISHELIKDPVRLGTRDYERKNIVKWIKQKGTDPNTREKVKLGDLTACPNKAAISLYGENLGFGWRSFLSSLMKKEKTVKRKPKNEDERPLCSLQTLFEAARKAATSTLRDIMISHRESGIAAKVNPRGPFMNK